MNGYERIKSVLNGEMPDSRPVMLHSFLLAVNEAGITMQQYRDNPRMAADAHIRFAEKYDVDGLLIDIDTATLSYALGVPTDYPENEAARNHGVALHNLEDIVKWPDVDLSQNLRVQNWLETTRLVKEHFKNDKFIRGNCDQAAFSLASLVRGMDNWMTDLMLAEPEVLHSLLDYCCSATCQFIELMAQTGADMVSNGDSVAGPELISPEMYREFAFPYEKKIVDKAHQLGLPYMLHICGNTNVILEHMAELNLDGVELDYKTSIHEIYRVFGNNTVFCGNIDPSGVIGVGTPAMVEKKVRELLDIYKDSPWLIVNAGCAIPGITPEANIRRLIETVRGC